MVNNPLKTVNALDNRLNGTRKMLCLCLNVSEKIVVKHMYKLLKLNTPRRRRLRKSIRRNQLSSGRVMTDTFSMTIQ
ncbi:hypothetical protein TNCV_4999231 [Trichonephila clavipes]|nr:hypothetical protein TNCV_4999231 [Trichonephila clavipes]